MTTQSAFEIQLVPGQPQKFTIPLGNIPYIFRLQWNDANQSWTLDIADQNDNALIYGIPVVTGLDLLAPYEHLGIGGALIAQTDHDADAVPTFDNLGVSGRLYFVPGALFDINQMLAAVRQQPVIPLPAPVLPAPAAPVQPPPPAPPAPPAPPPGPAPAPPALSPDEILADGFPRKILACYFESYNYGDGFTIEMVPLEFNVIFIFTCNFATDGTPLFPEIDNVLPAQVQRVRARGQRVILTVGGSGNQFNFSLRTQSQAFINGIQTIITALGGVDGIDFNNYEQVTQTSTEMIWIAQQLRLLYGATFGITSPAGGANTGGLPIGGTSLPNHADIDLIGAMHDAGELTFVNPQFYDWSFYKGVGTVTELVNRWATRVTESQVVVGFSANYNLDNSLTLAECLREWATIQAAHPNIRGMYCWNAKTNAVIGGNEWGRAMREQINGFVITPVPSASITVERHPADWLKIDQYLIEDGRQAADQFAEGALSYQFAQAVGRSNSVSGSGQIAWRTQWRWPFSDQAGNIVSQRLDLYKEVKAFPCVIYGARPGLFGPDIWPGWEVGVRAPDGVTVPTPPSFAPSPIAANWQPLGGSLIQVSPSGGSGAALLPRQLPAQVDLHAELRFAFANGVKPTGIGHLSFDIWLTDPVAAGVQAFGFAHAPITHEIMIPLANWGNYGSPHTVGGLWARQTAWFIERVVLGGIAYLVYNIPHNANAVEYNFNVGVLDGTFTNEETGTPRRGWKFIVFEPEVLPSFNHPTDVNGLTVVPIGAILNYLNGKLDSRGIALARGTEYISSIELGAEMVDGAGDLTVFNYRVATGATAAPAPAPTPPGPAPAPPPPPPAPPPAPPPPGDSAPALIFTGAGQPMGAWLDTDLVSRFLDEQTGGVPCTTFSHSPVGRWLDRSGNVSDMICTGLNTERPFLSDTTGSGARNGLVVYGSPNRLLNIGSSSTGFYFAIAVWWDTYYGQLIADSDGTRSSGLGTQTTGLRLQYDSDYQEWQLCAGTGTGQVVARIASGSTAGFASPASWFVVDGFVDPTGALISIRVNKGTPVTTALPSYAAGVSPMCLGVLPDGSDQVSGMKLARMVMTKNYIPVSTTRDAIVDELKALVGIP